MGSESRYDRRGNHRQRLPAQNAQQWVPRGSTTAATTAITATPATVVSAPSYLNTNPNGNGRDSNSSSTQPNDRRRGHIGQQAPRAPQSHMAPQSSRAYKGPQINMGPQSQMGQHSHVGPQSHTSSGPQSHTSSRFQTGAQSQMGQQSHMFPQSHTSSGPQSHTSSRFHTDAQSQMGRFSYQKKERPRANHGGSGLKDMNPRYQGEEGLKDKSVPQLVQEIQEKLMKGAVECMICYDMVRRSAPIWSCSSCYSIFHLNCIKKWAKAPTSVDLSAEKNQGLNWRCPGCQSVQLTASKEIRYVCFCGKRQDPTSDMYLTPHSCGEACGKPLEKDFIAPGASQDDRCPHICVLQCHPGPCPPCKAFAPPRLCPCGKKLNTTRCSDRKSDITCGQPCEKLLDCGRHCCNLVCHLGRCDPCQVPINASCFCKKKSEEILCGEMVLKGELSVGEGVFSCNTSCGKTLKCGNHVCSDICHPGPCGDCEFLPGKIKTCYCGKTKMQEERKSCLDPIPTCPEICDKTLPCGVHLCKEKCHAGACAPCTILATQNCRCGSTSRTLECYKTMMEEEKFTCDKPCGRKKTCGRHRCSERCCPLSNSQNSASDGSNLHLCSMLCGKKLRCGQHSCGSLCHSGHCPPCLETIFTDLSCACGRTSIPPPQPCGTPTPSCQYPCVVPQPCGHSSSHSCHFGDCPPCSVPIANECSGGHVVLRNIPCGSKDIRCNKLCGKTRQCGMHACARICHPPPCDSSCGPSTGCKASCGQTCGAPKRDCRHTCTSVCHPSSPCPDVRCEFPITITCSCGRMNATVPCDAGGNCSGYSGGTVLEAFINQKLPAPLQPVEGSDKKVPLGQRKLLCDDECTKTERKRVLADAFGVTTPNLDAFNFAENCHVSEALTDLYRRDTKWVISVEERCKSLVLGKARGGLSALRVHVFCPMLKEKRDAVRMIAERWKLSINAAGWEPRRFIVVHATPKSKSPARLLGPKSSVPANALSPPVLDPLIDMDPRLVVALFDLPRDADDISALVLRFGGECELLWLNDKNALAVFSDPARAATAMRRLDQGTVYHGVAVVPLNGGASASAKGNPWKKAVVQDSNQSDSWDGEDWSADSTRAEAPSVWKGIVGDAPVATIANRWTVLESEKTSTSTSTSATLKSEKMAGTESVANFEPKASGSGMGAVGEEGKQEITDVIDDWEKACD